MVFLSLSDLTILLPVVPLILESVKVSYFPVSTVLRHPIEKWIYLLNNAMWVDMESYGVAYFADFSTISKYIIRIIF